VGSTPSHVQLQIAKKIIKKRINTGQFIDRRAELYVQNFLAKLQRVKCWRQDQQEVVMKNHSGSLFGMT